MQLATSTLSQYATLSFPEPLTQDECQDAASWVTPKLGKNKERDFFRADGVAHHLLGDLVQAVTRVLEYLFIQTLEVPYIYVHRRDYLWSFNPANIRGRQELLNLDDLWRIYNLGQKYRSLLQRRKALHAIYQKLNVSDEYYEERLKDRTESVEGVADISQWLALKYKAQKRDSVILGFDDDERSADKKHKLPNRTSAYDIAKRSIISRLADVSLNSPDVFEFIYNCFSLGIRDQVTRSCSKFSVWRPEFALRGGPRPTACRLRRTICRSRSSKGITVRRIASASSNDHCN